MAIVHNPMLIDYSGKLGDIILRRRANGKTVAYRRPVSKNGWKPTPGQKINREKFKLASEFALDAMANPELREFYKARENRSMRAFLIAVRDARKPPEILDIRVNYNGAKEGPSIVVKTIDDTMVCAVQVTIFDSVSQELLSGQSTEMDNGIGWEFRTPQDFNLEKGWVIQAIAVDKPGNETVVETIF